MARRISVEIVGDSRSLERAFKRSNKAADSFSGKMSSAAKGLAKGLAVAGVAAGGLAVAMGVKSVQAAAKFESTMARVQGLAGQSQAQVAKWSDQLLALGPALGKSPQELAEALYFIASSGVPAGKAISVLTASAKAAAAGLGETEVVADAVTSVMNAYAKQGMSAAHATSVLVDTVREGKGEADAFAGVIGNVAAFASKLNVRFEEVGAALAAMTQLGTDPRTAATQLQAFFSAVLKVSPKAAKAAKTAGLDFSHLADTLQRRGLLAALEEVKEAFKGDTAAMAQAFPNIRALRALLALTANDGGKVAGVFRRMSTSTGSLGTAWGAAQKTASLNMARFSASIEALKIAFGQGLLPVVTKAAQALAQRFADPAFVQRVRELGFLIGNALYKAFLAISAWFQRNWGTIKTGFATLRQIIGATVQGVESLKGALEGLGTFAAIAFRAMLIPARTLLTIWEGILRVADKLGGWIPKIGDGIGGALEAVQSARAAVDAADQALQGGQQQQGQQQGGRRRRGVRGAGVVREARGAIRPRAHGGPVMPGVTYRVGERGPEYFTPNAAGNIGAGGGMHIGVVNVYGVQNARQLIAELQRHAKRGSAQQRGRYSGQNLAFS